MINVYDSVTCTVGTLHLGVVAGVVPTRWASAMKIINYQYDYKRGLGVG